MASDRTSIAWTDATWGPVRGCSLVSSGCTNCYAMKMAHRFSGPGAAYEGLTRMTAHGPVWIGDVRLVPEALDIPLRWRKPRRIFVNSMSDLFHEGVPDEYIAAVFGVMAAAPLHTFQILTKRPDRMRQWCEWLASKGGIGPYLRGDGREVVGKIITNKHTLRTEVYRGVRHRSAKDAWMMVFNAAACSPGNPLGNVWLGCSVEDQATADSRIPLLLQTPAAVRFVSYEPALGAVDFRSVRWWQANYAASAIPSDAPEEPEEIDALSGSMRDGEDMFRVTYEGEYPRLDWIIVGSESGPRRRPMQLEWARSTVDQCAKAGVACFVKQISNELDHKGEDPQHWPPGHWPREFPTLPAQGAGAVE